MTTAVALKVFGHLSHHRLLMDIIALYQGFPDSCVICAINNIVFELMFVQADIK